MKEDIKKNVQKKSLIRLIACQALCMYYDINNEEKSIDKILKSINDHYVEVEFPGGQHNDLYKKAFTSNLINNVITNSTEYDILINKFLDKQYTTETLDDILVQSFRLAIYELKNTAIKKSIIINEYVDIVAEFYNDVYVNFANGILDNIAAEIRDGGQKKESIKKTKTTLARSIIKLKK
ncbi:MAG: transcription antitermination protein NusB [Rickettsiales bacterium]|jgi:transcription termination factor NusB|nr:transcription antitermination protein NusB [Rickettsiales bacterium]